jgi:hypothetical protein
MSKYIKQQNEARKDVDAGLKVWKTLITDRLDEKVAYSYVKGSAIKKWETLIDYVPIISDIDIHLGTINYQPLFSSDKDGFIFSLETTRLYEELFREIRPDSIHIPRPQIVIIAEHQTLLLPEKTDNILPLYGVIPYRDEESEMECKTRDLSSLKEVGGVLERLPFRVVDRIGLEYFRILREICWIVSPTPVRVLSQFSDSKTLWNLNRTNVVNSLKKIGLGELAEVYKSYYLKGWEAFNSGFTDNKTMRELLYLAHNVLQLSIDTLRIKKHQKVNR